MTRPAAVLLLLSCCLSARAQGPQNVLLVVNLNSRVSQEVAQYYRQRRAVPAGQVCSIRAPETEEIDRAVFDRQIRLPLLACVDRGGMQDRILYVVLTKGVPLKVKGSSGEKGEQASVDSELTLLYQDLLGLRRTPTGRAPNPYFAPRAGGTKFSRFSHREYAMYLVTRLDGYDLNDIRALIDRGLSPSREGRFILDLKRDDNAMGNDWLRQAAERLHAAGIPSPRIRLETSAEFLTGQKDVLGYAGWGSNDPSARSRFLGHTWVRGALLAEYVSTDARTFEKPPDNWNIGKWSDRQAFFKDSPQSLIADYIHEGVSGAAGYVYEPFLDACVRPQALFPAYVSGLNLAESYYAAMPYLSWQAVVVGDPLVAPFPRPRLPAAEAAPPLEKTTLLPLFLAQKMVALRASATNEKPPVVALLIGAERRSAAGDLAGARRAAEKALAASPSSVPALFLAATLEKNPERAVGLYRKLAELDPRHMLGLNNLAYLLATHGKPQEALPFAARAADIAQGRSFEVLDTYGWVLFLLGKYEEARSYLEKAAAAQPSSPVLALHLGLCLNKLSRRAEGRAYLERALTMNPDPETAAAIRKALQE